MSDTPADKIEAIVRKAIQDGIAPVQRQLAGLEEEFVRTQTTVHVLAHRAGVGMARPPGLPDDIAEVHQPDTMWNCLKCGTRLGLYDPALDILRVRYKDHLTYIHLGPGGFVRIPCRNCGAMGVLDYSPAEDAGAIPVANGVAVLTKEMLLFLLEKAEASATGDVHIPIGPGTPAS